MSVPTSGRGLLLAVCCASTLVAAPERGELVACRIETDRGVVPADKPETAIVKVTLAADRVASRERPPINLALVLDRSGSMGGEKIARAREAAIAAIRRLDGRDMVSVVVYDHEVETLVPAQPARNSEWIEGRIAQITARGNTALFAGLSQSASELRKNLDTGRINRAILLSDGLANTGPSSPDEVGRLGAALMKEAIAVTTIVGTDYNEDLMTRVSGNSDGNSYFVEKSDDLPAIFTKELGDVLSVVASRVRLTVRFRAGATPIECIGRDGRIVDNTVTVDLNQLYGGQEKYLLIRVELAPVAMGDASARRCRSELRGCHEPPFGAGDGRRPHPLQPRRARWRRVSTFPSPANTHSTATPRSWTGREARRRGQEGGRAGDARVGGTARGSGQIPGCARARD